MKFNYLITKIPYFAALTLLFSLASCGSYEYVGHDNDGVYGSNEKPVEYQTEKQTEVQTNDNGVYYKNYFSEKSRDYEGLTDNGEVFTDIDSYQSEYDEEVIDTLQYENAYAGWGQNNDDVTINIYNRGYNYWGYNSYWRYGWGYSSFYDPFGFPYYSGFWNHNPYYVYHYNYFGYGYPYYGYGPLYYNNHYYNGIYSRRNYAYNRGRRGSVYNNNLSSLSRRSSAATRLRSSTSRSNPSAITPRNNTPRTTTQPRSNTSRPRAIQPRSNTSRPRATQPRSSTPRASTPRSINSRPSTTQPSRSSTPRASAPRSSTPRSSASRSSSSSRSSGSSSSSISSGRRR